MGRFVESVKRKELIAPASYGFSIRRWKKASVELCDDALDRNLHAAGEWIHGQIEAPQTQHVYVCRDDIQTPRKLRSIIAVANVAFADTLGFFEDAAKQQLDGRQTLIPEELRTIQRTSPNGAVLPKEDIVESIAAGLLVTFRYLLRPRKGRPIPLVDRTHEFDGAQADLNLALVYYWLQSTWERCLWEGYEFVEGAPAHFRPRHLQLLDSFVVTRERQDKLCFAQHEDTRRHLLEDRKLAASIITRPVIGLEKVDKHQRLLLGEPGRVTPSGIAAATMRVVVRKQYLEEIWDDASPTYPGLTLGLVLKGWEVIPVCISDTTHIAQCGLTSHGSRSHRESRPPGCVKLAHQIRSSIRSCCSSASTNEISAN